MTSPTRGIEILRRVERSDLLKLEPRPVNVILMNTKGDRAIPQGTLRHVDFVMKGGAVFRQAGRVRPGATRGCPDTLPVAVHRHVIPSAVLADPTLRSG